MGTPNRLETHALSKGGHSHMLFAWNRESLVTRSPHLKKTKPKPTRFYCKIIQIFKCLQLLTPSPFFFKIPCETKMHEGPQFALSGLQEEMTSRVVESQGVFNGDSCGRRGSPPLSSLSTQVVPGECLLAWNKSEGGSQTSPAQVHQQSKSAGSC